MTFQGEQIKRAIEYMPSELAEAIQDEAEEFNGGNVEQYIAFVCWKAQQTRGIGCSFYEWIGERVNGWRDLQIAFGELLT